MDTTTVASEKGGIGKTTVTVGIARELAGRGVKVGVVDLDPRATVTTWLDVEVPPGEHVGAILGQDDVAGAAADLALTSPWHSGIDVVPGSRDVAALEGSPQEYGDLRLRRAIAGWDRDVVLIDSPNRQGGLLIRSALTASDRVLYATTPDEDGRSGVEWARRNTARFKQLSPLNPDVAEVGIILTRWPDTIPTRDAVNALEALEEDNAGPTPNDPAAGPALPVLRPLVPERVAVRSARAARVWWGDYTRGELVAAAFRDIVDQVWPMHRSSEGETR
ncbi:ParA family protein [Luteimicrobium sp. DT211]|uniref:ParA family protein n=1 Tax=Luteimicrobium sp. DT211 TaxID=3393412 RepID=UPI003CE6C391